MNKHATTLALLSCIFACGEIARAGDSSLQTTLQGRYAAMKVAMSAHDDKAISALLASDFVSSDVSGQSERAAQMIQEVDALPKDANKVSATTIVSVKAAGNTATVHQRYDMKTVKAGADGSSQNVELIALSTDTWTNADGIWLLQSSQTEQVDYYVDGQQVLHKVRSSV